MRCMLTVSMLTVLICGIAVAQEEGDLLSVGFEEDLAGFVTMDREGTLKVTHDEDAIFKGDGALEMAFMQRPMQKIPGEMDVPGSIVLPIETPLADLKGLSFAIATAFSTPSR